MAKALTDETLRQLLVIARARGKEVFDRVYGLVRIRRAGVDLNQHPEYRSLQAFYELGVRPPTHHEGQTSLFTCSEGGMRSARGRLRGNSGCGEHLPMRAASVDRPKPRQAGPRQRRSNIEVRDRIRELEILREGPPVCWHAQMERMQREVRAQIEQSKEMLALAGDPAKASLYTKERIDREPDQEDVPGRSSPDLCGRLRPVVREPFNE